MPDTLLMIPDISGFTEFVNRTEISHSQHIISELLEIIIREQYLKMDIAEVEGDAVLFYRENFNPGVKAVLDQAELMFLKFHRHLKQYEHNRICNCGACSKATNLSLKFVVHKAETGITTVNQVKKPFGPGLVTVHRILKNSIPANEYLLFTHELILDIEKFLTENGTARHFHEGSDTYKSIGEIRYCYVDFAPLLDRVDEVKSPDPPSTSNYRTVYKGMIDRPADQVFEIISNLEYRIEWLEGLENIIYEKDRVNRIGTRHVCVYSGDRIDFETITGTADEEKMIYGEKMENVFFNREVKFFYFLEKREKSTLLTMEMHFNPKNVVGFLLLPLLRYQSRGELKKNFVCLKKYCESRAERIA